MSPTRILICGGGIAGSTCAYWLSKHGHDVVVIERSSSELKAGQGIDVEGPALEIVKRMNLLDEIKTKTTGEVGVAIMDDYDRPSAIFDVGKGISLTRSIEIMRGDLVEILYRAADKHDNVTFHFKTAIRSMDMTSSKVNVELEDLGTKSLRTEEFDIVIGADGVRSQTRQLAMGSPAQLNCLAPVGGFCAFFSIPKEDQDWPRSRLCQFPDRRSICIRPRSEGDEPSSVYMSQLRTDNARLRAAFDSGDRQRQKEVLVEMFSGLQWETPRVIREMQKTNNFYLDEVMQVKLQKWHQGRVVLVGDAGYAPSPLTGQGTALAILGSYVLAQELAAVVPDREEAVVEQAFTRYETRLRSYVENAQIIPLAGYLPFILNPQTAWGIWLLRTFVGFISWTGISKYISEGVPAKFDLENPR